MTCERLPSFAKESGFENFERLTDDDKTLIREEKLHRWRQPKTMYYMTSMLKPQPRKASMLADYVP